MISRNLSPLSLAIARNVESAETRVFPNGYTVRLSRSGAMVAIEAKHVASVRKYYVSFSDLETLVILSSIARK